MDDILLKSKQSCSKECEEDAGEVTSHDRKFLRGTLSKAYNLFWFFPCHSFATKILSVLNSHDPRQNDSHFFQKQADDIINKFGTFIRFVFTRDDCAYQEKLISYLPIELKRYD